MIKTFCYIFFLWVTLPRILSQRPQVTISDGTLIGITMQTWLGRDFSAFRNIPFAAPPLGQLRFLPPQPPIPWFQPRDAGVPSPECPQMAPGLPLGTPNPVRGVEDCLYLNVYTPRLPSSNGSNTNLLPVLYYIHPGSFTFLSSATYGPRYLLDYELVLVLSNYRLGTLGFLTSGDSVVPGNMGLKDQVAALKWIQRNILAFGGNPNSVTISGTSAGGSSVQLHFTSRMSQGLFHRGICGSGTALMPVAHMKAPIYKFHTAAKVFNCRSNNSNVIVNCLRRVPANALIEFQRLFQGFYSNPSGIFLPVVEPDLPTSFLIQLSYESLREGNLANFPTLFTTVTQEGLFPAGEFLGNSSAMSYVNDNWNLVAPYLLDYQFTVPSRDLNTVSQKVRYYYFRNQTISISNNQSLAQLCGDRLFTDDIETSARLQANVNTAPVYLARFGYRGRFSVTNILGRNTLNFGVGHSDDIIYLFNITFNGLSAETTSSDREMIKVLTGIWANFTITGNPGVPGISWTPLERNNSFYGPLNYLMISSPTNIFMNSSLDFGHPQFWNYLPINEPWAGRPINTNLK